MFFSKTTNGFYDPEIHGENIPEDAVAITHERHVELMAGQSAGKIISGDNDGYPILSDPPIPSNDELMAAELNALSVAYKADLQMYDLRWLAAIRTDGETEATKKAQITQAIADAKTKFLADVAAVRAKYA